MLIDMWVRFYSPGNICSVSSQNNVAEFSETTEADGDLK